MDCRQAQERSHDLVDGRLSMRGAADLLEHLEECGACREHHRSLEVLARLLREADVPDSGHSRHRVMNRFRASIPSSAGRRPSRFAPPTHAAVRLGGLAAAAAVLAAGPLLLWLRPPDWVPDSGRAAREMASAREADALSARHAAYGSDLAAAGAEVSADALADASARLDAASDDCL